MSKETFTPGPWKYDPAWSLVYGPKGQEIAALHAGQEPGGKRVKSETAQANARLIAAAPELYAALAGIVANEHGCTCPEKCDGQCWHSIARAALARARGEA